MSGKKRPCFSVSGVSYIRLRSGAWSRGISVARLVDNAINKALDQLEDDYVSDINTQLALKNDKIFAPPRIK